MSGRKLAAALAVIALLAFVLPPIAAHQVHVGRIDRARDAVVRLAAALAGEAAFAQNELVRRVDGDQYVFAGQGVPPAFAPGLGWPAGRVISLSAVSQSLSSTDKSGAGSAIDARPDPWGNQFLVVATVAGSKTTIAVISAGPNGTIDTPFEHVWAPQGDDIVAVR